MHFQLQFTYNQEERYHKQDRGVRITYNKERGIINRIYSRCQNYVHINRLKWFCGKINICGDICKIMDLSQANTAESGSAQANTAQSQTPRRLTLDGVRLRAD